MDYTEFQINILEKLNALISETSQAKAAQLTGISASAISTLRKGEYKGSTETVFRKLAEYFGVKEEAELTYSEVEYANTSISGQIYDIIRICHVKGGLAIACGDAGIGKTKAVRKYASDYSTNTVVVTMNPCLTGVKSLLCTLAGRLGADRSHSIPDLWNAIVSKLTDGMVIIFDEAQHMTLKDIEILRSFSDYFTDKGQTLGIVFIGNPETVYKMGVKKAEFAQIANRTKQIKIYSTSEIQRDDIEKLFPILKGHDKEIDLLWKIAKTHQGIRGTVNLFSNAYDNENYTYAGLKAMAEFMNISY